MLRPAKWDYRGGIISFLYSFLQGIPLLKLSIQAHSSSGRVAGQLLETTP